MNSVEKIARLFDTPFSGAGRPDEFYPPLRARDRLKYLAGSEIGAAMFINDTLPEAKAAELRTQVKPNRHKEELRQRD